MGHILKIVLVFGLVEFSIFQSEASPSNLGAQKLTIAKPTFMCTAQFVDRCTPTKMCTLPNKQSQFQRARISSTALPSLKINSMSPGSSKNNRQTKCGKEFIDAVKKNDLKSLTKLIATKVDVDEKDNSGMTALHWAAENGHVEAAKMLIKNKAEIDARDKYFNTPLHIACSHDFTEMIELLIDSGANIYAYNLMNVYPLKLCSMSIGNLRPYLLKAVEKADKLFSAVESGDLKSVQKLIVQRLNINFENSCGQTALTVAILRGHRNIAEWLVKNGADVNLDSCDGITPLELAKNAGMKLPPCKVPDWKTIITSARNTVNEWLVDNPSLEEIRAAKKLNNLSLTWFAYHPLNDIFLFLYSLRAMNSKICSLHEIGEFTQSGRRPLKVLKISNGNPNNKAIWIDGAIHGNEWITTSSVTYIANELTKNWNTPHIQNIDWYILAVQNPDGYEDSFNSNRLWRKNRISTEQNGSVEDDTHGGLQTFSDQETSTIKKFIRETLEVKLNAFISFQSYGQYVMYYDNDGKDVERVGREGVKRMQAVDNQNYRFGTAKSMFNATTTGSASEWAKRMCIKYSYTVNLRDTGRFGYLLPPAFIEITAKEAQAFVWTVSKAIFNESK